MSDYYSDKLSAERLKQCYELAPPRVRQYLQAELDYSVNQVKPGYGILELGCGYGRVLKRLAEVASTVIGIDTSISSLEMARSFLANRPNCSLARMNAVQMGFRDNFFDTVVCIQNGLSAFHVDQRRLIEECLRVTRAGGRVLFSTYSERFWDERLNWFEMQARGRSPGKDRLRQDRRWPDSLLGRLHGHHRLEEPIRRSYIRIGR